MDAPVHRHADTRAAGTHLGIALLNHGKPPQHWAHWLAFQLRRKFCGNVLSAAARSRAPQFPFGPYRSRV
jgi:hypothetical protein